jgi:hypothetical protein
VQAEPDPKLGGAVNLVRPTLADAERLCMHAITAALSFASLYLPFTYWARRCYRFTCPLLIETMACQSGGHSREEDAHAGT